MHATLAAWNQLNNKEYLTLEYLHMLLRRNWIRIGYESIEKERTFGLRGLKMLSEYFYNPLDQGKENLIVEKFIKVDLDDSFTLCGKLDKSYRHLDNTIEVLDYKTGASMVPFDILQLYIYSLLCKGQLGAYPQTVSYYFLANNRKETWEVTEDFLAEGRGIYLEVIERIKKETNYAPNPSINCKTNCPYIEKCDTARDSSHLIINSFFKNGACPSEIQELF